MWIRRDAGGISCRAAQAVRCRFRPRRGLEDSGVHAGDFSTWPGDHFRAGSGVIAGDAAESGADAEGRSGCDHQHGVPIGLRKALVVARADVVAAAASGGPVHQGA